jgi:RND family efflux transporter MFP subunit
MTARKLWMPLLVLLGAALGAYLLLATAPQVESVSAEKAIPMVRTLDVRPADVRMTVRSQGTVAPRTESNLVPEVSGTVVWVSPALVSGGFFSEGEPLLRIDERDHLAALARARAEVARAEGEAEHAAGELQRQRGLARSNANSPAQLSNALRAQRVAEASLEAARVSLEQAQRDLDRCELTAPFDGRVRSEQVDVGQFVARGTPIATLYATDFAEIRLPLADRQLAFLELPGMHEPRGSDAFGEGPAVRLYATFAGQEQTWTGHIVRTEGEIDAQSRMVHVVARVEDPYGTRARKAAAAEAVGAEPSASDAAEAVGAEPGASDAAEAVAVMDDDATFPLAVGLFVRAEIDGRWVEDVLVVPRPAMRDDDRLLVVDADDHLHLRAVDVLRIDRDEVLIRADLDAGDRVVVSPIQVVVEGMRVRPIDDSPIADAGTTRS